MCKFSRREAAGLFDQIIGCFQEEGAVPTISIQPDNMQVALTNVASGLGVSGLPSCTQNMYSNGCVFIPILGQKPSIAAQLHLRTDPLLLTVRAFVDIVLKNRDAIKKAMEVE